MSTTKTQRTNDRKLLEKNQTHKTQIFGRTDLASVHYMHFAIEAFKSALETFTGF